MSTKRKKPVAKRRSPATKRTRKFTTPAVKCRLFVHSLLVALVVFMASFSVYVYGLRSAEAATCQSVIIPAYSYPNPTTFWDGSINAHPPVSIMIADPANGPGTIQDSNYVSVIARAKAAGIKVLGYVDTNYTARSTSTVNTDVDTWKTLYNLNDIFFDQTSSGAGDLAYYQTIANHVHATSGAITMFNPGTGTDEGYMAMADILNIFEGTPSDYTAFSMPPWTANYAANRFSHLIYGVPDAAAMTSTLATSVSRHAGYVFITADVQPNPWDELPPYWAAEVSQINTACNPPSSGGGGSSSPSPSPSSGSGTTSKTGTGSTGTTTTPKAAGTTPPPASGSSGTSSLSPTSTESTAVPDTTKSNSIVKSMPVKSRWWPLLVAGGGVVILAASLGGLWALHRWRGHHLIAPSQRPPTIFPTAPTVFR